jgi:hypothetical protein
MPPRAARPARVLACRRSAAANARVRLAVESSAVPARTAHPSPRAWTGVAATVDARCVPVPATSAVGEGRTRSDGAPEPGVRLGRFGSATPRNARPEALLSSAWKSRSSQRPRSSGTRPGAGVGTAADGKLHGMCDPGHGGGAPACRILREPALPDTRPECREARRCDAESFACQVASFRAGAVARPAPSPRGAARGAPGRWRLPLCVGGGWWAGITGPSRGTCAADAARPNGAGLPVAQRGRPGGRAPAGAEACGIEQRPAGEQPRSAAPGPGARDRQPVHGSDSVHPLGAVPPRAILAVAALTAAAHAVPCADRRKAVPCRESVRPRAPRARAAPDGSSGCTGGRSHG